MADNKDSCPGSLLTLPSSGTIFGLLRHGTTRWNEEKRIQGREDTPLTLEGKKKTVIWSHYLTNFKWDRIAASDLGRVKETVSILNRTLDLPISWDKRLREQNWGDWEGMRLTDVKNSSPEMFGRQINAGWDFKPPQGESRRSVQQRAHAAILETTAKWPNKKILVVCHQGVIKCLLYHIAKRSFLPEESKLIDKDRLHTIIFNDGIFEILQRNMAPDTL
jgi:broad specificity phosphatase PhoE